jgi:hypothetical protein
MAALVGALKFSGYYVNDPLHRFVSLIAGVAGFPALAISMTMIERKATSQWWSSFLIVAVCAGVGILTVMATGSRAYLNTVSVLSTLCIVVACWRQRYQVGVVSAAIMLIGLILFATKQPAGFNVLQPADFLHLALAAGWLGLSGFWKSHAD